LYPRQEEIGEIDISKLETEFFATYEWCLVRSVETEDVWITQEGDHLVAKND